MDQAWYRRTVAEHRENLGRAVAAQPRAPVARVKHPIELAAARAKAAVDDRWRERLARVLWAAAALGPGEEIEEADALELADAAAALRFPVSDFGACVEAAREVLAEREERREAQEAVDALDTTEAELEEQIAGVAAEMEEACKPFRERISRLQRRAAEVKRTHGRLVAAHNVERYARQDWGSWLYPIGGMPVDQPTQRAGACNVSNPR